MRIMPQLNSVQRELLQTVYDLDARPDSPQIIAVAGGSDRLHVTANSEIIRGTFTKGALESLYHSNYIALTPTGTKGTAHSIAITPLGRRVVESGFDHQTSLAPPISAGPTFNMENVYGSIVGTQETATVDNPTFDFRVVELEIEQRGGADVDELKRMVSEISETLQRQDQLPQGVFARYSALMELNSWIAGSITQAVLQYIMTGGNLGGT